jgi:hypothetical protein
MSLSTLKVFSQYAYTSMLELIAQQIALFNAATRGALTLRTAANQGDYSDVAMYQRISGLVRRRNAYGSGAVTHKELTMLLTSSVKVAAGTPPVDIDPHWWQWIQRSPEEAGVVLGKQLAEDTMQDMLNTAIAGLVAAVGAQSTNLYDHTATGTPTLNVLQKGAAKFGDRAQDLVAWILHSKSIFDIYDVSLTNSNTLFTFGTVKVVEDGFGRPLIVTDSPGLTYEVAGPATRYNILGLVSGAALVEQNNDYTENIETKNGDENIQRTYQAQWSYNLGLKGFTWDKTNGGASPTSAALATATNWDKFATSSKDLAGVLIKVQ